MEKEIYTLIDKLLQEDLLEARKAYKCAKVQYEDLDEILDEALMTYGNTAKNRIMKLKELDEQ